ncbi:MAG: RNA polymerase sigma factor [Oscillospiraceae bacterium]|jgi:RNA polymerase sigma factor (sigma-70 family)|nr:RNA polymerase sigma factor [Oscillospiraceae bacterium]
MDEELRGALLRLIRHKFAGYPNASSLAEDIVHDAYETLRTSRQYAPEKENYGYLSVVCIRLAYRKFMAQSADFRNTYLDAEGTSLIDESDIADELLQTEDANAVLESLKVLREIERIVVTQRYYGDFSFAEIAKRNGLKLNTVLSHHRRALGKLRPQLTKLLGYGKETPNEYNSMETRQHR